MDELTKLIGAPPSTFNYDSGTIRYQNLTRLDPNNYYLIPPPGAPKDTVSVKACELLAGPGYGTYGRGNTLDAIGTWVVPLLVLVGNVNYASFSSHKYWNQITVVVQLFGNPIHAIWALLLKLDVKRRCEARCRAELKGVKNAEDEIWIYSTLLYALDDFAFSERFDDHFEILMCIAKSRQSRSKTACRRAAVQLTLSRVNNTRRALFAILGYLAAITANVLRAVFSETIQLHISHTIALRELNFWLISAIILSARVGGFPSEWEAVRVLLDLQSQLKEPRTNQRQTIGPERKRYEFGLKRLEPWTGGNYTYRPKKDNSKEISGFSDYRFLILASLAFASVTIAMLTSLWMSYLTPTSGIGVRSIVELSYWAWWCFNAGLTYAVDQIGGISKRKWLYTIGKDGVSAVFTIVFLFSAWSGKYLAHLSPKLESIETDCIHRMVEFLPSLVHGHVSQGEGLHRSRQHEVKYPWAYEETFSNNPRGRFRSSVSPCSLHDLVQPRNPNTSSNEG